MTEVLQSGGQMTKLVRMDKFQILMIKTCPYEAKQIRMDGCSKQL